MRPLRSLFLLAALAVPCVALATPITYSLTATASGSLGGSSFTDAAITFTEVADTDNIAFRNDYGAFYNPGSVNVSVSGVGDTTLDNSFSFFSIANYGYYGVINTAGNAGALTSISSLGSYDLSTALPMTSVDSGYSTGDLTGTAGILDLSSLTDGAASASTDPVAVTPEPSTLLLLSTGLLGLFLVTHRRASERPAQNHIQ